jgi:hypothetical protein
MDTVTRCRSIRTAGFLRLSLLAAVIYSANSNSADIGAAFSLGVGYTDNINLDVVDGVDETIASSGIALSFIEVTRKIDADVRGNLDYYNYLEDTNDNEVVAALDGLIDIELVQDRLQWLIQENYGRTTFDPFMPARPENMENLNFLTTGPTIILYQGTRNDSGIDLRYSRLDYETRPFDNERQSALFWIRREVRRDHWLSINADAERIEFDNDGLTPDYKRRSAYLRYEGTLGRNLLDISAGYTEQEILSDTGDGILLNASWTHQFSTLSQFTLNAGRQFADQGNVFRYQQDITRDLDSVGDLTENGSPFRMDNIDLLYSLAGERTTLAFTVGVSEQRYETQGENDRDDARIELFALRDLTRSLYSSIDVRFQRREFPNIARDDDTLSASLTFGYRFSAAIDLSLRYTYQSRDSSAVTDGFDVHRGDLTLTYTPAWGR